MRFALLTATAALAVTAAGPASARVVFEPSSVWELNYDTDSCALRRMFGEGKEQAYLELRRFEPGLGLQATIADNRMRVRTPVAFKYRFGDDGEWQEADFGNWLKMAEQFDGVLFSPKLVSFPEAEKLEDPAERFAYFKSIDRPAVEKEAAARTDSITLRGAFVEELTLQFGSLEKPMAALNDCIDELMTHWGIDVEAHKSLTRPAMPTNLPEVPRMISYPPKMAQRRMPGLVNIRLEIDDKGLVAACHIQMPLSDPAFEATSCVDIQHALEFDPALDKDGKPIASYYVTRIAFQAP
jgi:hypothetical protein